MRHVDLSIGQRLALGFGAVLLLILFLVAVFAFAQQRQNQVVSRLTAGVMPRADAARDVEISYLRLSAAVHSYIFSGDESYLNAYREAAAASQNAVSRLGQISMTGRSVALFGEVQSLGSQYMAATERTIALREQNDEPAAAQLVEQEVQPALDRLLSATDELVSTQLQSRDVAAAEVASVQAESDAVAALISLLAVLAGATIAFATARSVRGPAQQLGNASVALATGDFDSAIGLATKVEGTKRDGGSRDEMRQLGGSLAATVRALQGRDRRLLAQSDLSSALAASIETERLAADALRRTAEYAGLEFGLVYARDEDSNSLCLIGSHALKDTPDSIVLGDGIPGEAAASGQRIVVRDIPAGTPFQVGFGFDRVPPRVVLAEPLIAQDRTVGVLLLGGLHEPTSDAIGFIETSARQLAISLQNAMAHRRVQQLVEQLQEKNELLEAQNEELQAQSEEIQAQNEELQSQNEEIQLQSQELSEHNVLLSRQRERLANLQAIATQLSRSLASGSILDQVVGAAAALLNSSVAVGLVLDESKRDFRLAASVGLGEAEREALRIGIEESLAGQAMAERRTMYIEDMAQHLLIRTPILARGRHVGAIAVAPLMAGQEVLGVAEVYFAEPRPFAPEDVELFSALTAAASVALGNARLFDSIQQQDRLLRSVLASIPEAVLVADGGGRVIVANQAATEIFGLEESETIRKEPEHRNEDGPAEQAPDLWAPLLRALSGDATLGEEWRCAGRGSDREGYVQVSAVPLLSESGEVTNIVAVATDISRLKEVDRLKDEFISVASHELKSPLTAIKGFSQLLHRQVSALPNSGSHQRLAQQIDVQANRIVQLVDRLLDLSRAQMGRLEITPEPVDLGDLVAQQVQQVQVKTDKHQLIADLDDGALGNWDGGYLEEVVSNLLDNAIQYSPQGGEIRVSVKREDSIARLTVADQGIGVPPDLLPRLFTRYFRSDEAKQVKPGGMGIGLYLTHEIVAAHGGTISVSSEPGKGSLFVVELPLQRPDGATTNH